MVEVSWWNSDAATVEQSWLNGDSGTVMVEH